MLTNNDVFLKLADLNDELEVVNEGYWERMFRLLPMEDILYFSVTIQVVQLLKGKEYV